LRRSNITIPIKIILYETLLRPIWTYSIVIWGLVRTRKKNYKHSNDTINSHLKLPFINEIAAVYYKCFHKINYRNSRWAGSHFNFLIVSAKIFAGDFKSLPGHNAFLFLGWGLEGIDQVRIKILEYLYSLINIMSYTYLLCCKYHNYYYFSLTICTFNIVIFILILWLPVVFILGK